MKRLVLPTFLLAGLASLAACADNPAPLSPAAPAAALSTVGGPGQYLVVFRSQGTMPAGFASQVAALGGRITGEMPDIGAMVVDGLTPAAAQKLSALRGVESVGADVAIPMKSLYNTYDQAEGALDANPESATRPDLAGLYALQWNMTAINAKPAWLAGHLGQGVTIAILDTGIDPGISTPTNRRNLDLQGRVDAARSVSLMPVEDSVVTRLFGATKPKWTDLDGHGTNVASQVSSNGVNFAGVTSMSTLMAVKVCTIMPPAATPADTMPAPGFCSTNAVLQGIYYAVDHGADVINMSLGGGFVRSDCTGCESVFNRVLNYARSHGVTLVVAAGNSSMDLDHDKNWYNTYCSNPAVICVSASGPVSAGPGLTGPFETPDAFASYSNYGRSAIDVAGPGGNFKVGVVNGHPAIVDAAYVWALCPRSSGAFFDTSVRQAKALAPCGAWGYIGTSQASPHVAGLAALLVQVYGRNPGTIRDVILSTADDLGQEGTDPFYGKGRINVARALGL